MLNFCPRVLIKRVLIKMYLDHGDKSENQTKKKKKNSIFKMIETKTKNCFEKVFLFLRLGKKKN